MTDFPITPPPELVQQWEEDWHHSKVKHIELEPYIAAQASQWGADQELEACLRLVEIDAGEDAYDFARYIRAARRPKPPSLKEQALTALERYMTGETILTKDSLDTIRRALEQLPE
jgi:hypothetical protein